MVCRSDIGELRQIVRIADIGRDICLSAFEALPRIRLAACTQQVTVFSSSSSKQTTRHTKYDSGRGLAKFVRQRRGKRNACCSRAGSLVGWVAVRERDRGTRSASGLNVSTTSAPVTEKNKRPVQSTNSPFGPKTREIESSKLQGSGDASRLAGWDWARPKLCSGPECNSSTRRRIDPAVLFRGGHCTPRPELVTSWRRDGAATRG